MIGSYNSAHGPWLVTHDRTLQDLQARVRARRFYCSPFQCSSVLRIYSAEPIVTPWVHECSTKICPSESRRPFNSTSWQRWSCFWQSGWHLPNPGPRLHDFTCLWFKHWVIDWLIEWFYSLILLGSTMLDYDYDIDMDHIHSFKVSHFDFIVIVIVNDIANCNIWLSICYQSSLSIHS